MAVLFAGWSTRVLPWGTSWRMGARVDRRSAAATRFQEKQPCLADVARKYVNLKWERTVFHHFALHSPSGCLKVAPWLQFWGAPHPHQLLGPLKRHQLGHVGCSLGQTCQFA